mmetsp:Transcript_16009/g.31888  ORF Transcript_16009/g.31888 Transcript_16009/m.31888 type:complete len:93 (+) Transcript_16009:602-880(+)
MCIPTSEYRMHSSFFHARMLYVLDSQGASTQESTEGSLPGGGGGDGGGADDGQNRGCCVPQVVRRGAGGLDADADLRRKEPCRMQMACTFDH